MNTFSIDVPLDSGPLLVEASAGTGKTWSIARLVARLLVEPSPGGGVAPTIDQILVVTFTNAATAELRDRVRAFLLAAQAALLAAMASTATQPSDLGLAVLLGSHAAGSWMPFEPAILAHRYALVSRALRDFDLAAISTIHGFCQRMLQQLAFESGAAFDAELLEDTGPLIEEIVDDWMHRTLVPADDSLYRWLAASSGGGVVRARLLEIAHRAIAARSNPILPDRAYDWRAALQRRVAPAAKLAQRLSGPEGESLLAALGQAVANKSLKATYYKASALEAHMAGLVDWLHAGAFPLDGEPNADPLKRFCRSWMRENGLSKSGILPSHPLLDSLDAFAETLGDPVADGLVYEFVENVVATFGERMRNSHQQGFDDMLELVRSGVARTELVVALRRKFKAALIDEFQDTDATQWAIFQAVFLDADPSNQTAGRLILIGDPKQAIYAFRGADVAVYRQARDTIPPNRQFTMCTNFRTDQPTLTAIGRILGTQANVFLADGIEFRPVDAQYSSARLRSPTGDAFPPISLRWFDGVLAGGDSPTLSNTTAESFLPTQIAADVARELASGCMRATPNAESGQFRPLAARDIAVLTYSNHAAAAVHSALIAAGVPAVISQSGSVLTSAESKWVATWLAALAEGDDASARRFAITPLCGWVFSDLFAARSTSAASHPRGSQWPAFLARLRAHGRLIEQQSFTAALSAMLNDPTEPDQQTSLSRIAALPDGERRLTNLRHLGELLHGAATAEHLGAAGLSRWLAEHAAAGDIDKEASQLRLESEADAVQVVTMHRSKGLEYPIVFLPYLWDGRLLRGRDAERQPIRFHRPGESVVTTDVRGRAGANPQHAAIAVRELQEERQRLLYVALTRAMHRVVLYHGPVSGRGGFDVGASPLGLCFHGPPGLAELGDPQPGDLSLGSAARAGFALKQDPMLLRADLADLAQSSGGKIALQDVDIGPAPTHHAGAATPALRVAPAPFARGRLDTLWRRASYSGIVGERQAKTGEGSGAADTNALAQSGYEPTKSSVVPPPEARDHGEGVGADSDGAPAPDLASGSGAGVGGLPMHDSAAPAAGESAMSEVALTLPMLGFPAGAEAGTWVHGVFENLSFVSGQPKQPLVSLAQLVREHGVRNGFPGADADPALITALPTILRTPLGPQLGNLRLADIPDAHRLDEMGFDLAIGPGEAWQNHRCISGSELAQKLGVPRETSPLPAEYLAQVRTMGFRPLAGYLIGFIDLVFCVPVEGRPRWFVADYKTNTLGVRGSGGGPIVQTGPEHYDQTSMAKEIAKKHYYIQYLLYLVALHRYLQLRLRDYDYERDVGGAAYLFVRGMLGESSIRDAEGRVNGVFVDKPPLDIILGLSDLLARNEELPV